MTINPRVFLIADTHFGHEKQVSLWGKRPAGFEQLIIDNWNAVVRSQDVVLHLGDLTMVNKEKTMLWTKQLRGQKFLIKGNHDEASDHWFASLGFEVIPPAFMTFKTKYDQAYNVLFTHEPVQDLPDQYAAANGLPRWFNIHGHLHGDTHRWSMTSDHHFDVGVDPLGFKPIRLFEVLDCFKARLLSE